MCLIAETGVFLDPYHFAPALNGRSDDLEVNPVGPAKTRKVKLDS